jgi:hypothetical protein
MATTLKINANRRNAINPTPHPRNLTPKTQLLQVPASPGPYDLKSGIFKPPRWGPFAPDALWNKHS